MLKPEDEIRLLELIEDELDPQAAAVLRKRLEGHPKTQAFVEHAREDRALLQSLLEPALPKDYLSEIEPRLTRSLLLEDAPSAPTFTPGSYRRQQHHGDFVKRMRRFAIAAGILIPVGAAVWIGVHQVATRTVPYLSDQASKLADRIKADDSVAAENETVIAQAPIVPQIAEPLPVERPTFTMFEDDVRWEDFFRLIGRGSTHRYVADIGIVIRADELITTEQSLRTTMDSFMGTKALVRNFSFDEAQRMVRNPDRRSIQREKEERVASKEEPGTPADDASKLPRKAPTSRGIISQGVTDQRIEQTRDDLLSGTPTAAPPPEHQIEFSEHGAIYSVTLPLRSLPALLEKLHIQEKCDVSLSSVYEIDQLREGSRMNRWLSDEFRIRKAIRDLSADDRNAIILLPIFIESPQQ